MTKVLPLERWRDHRFPERKRFSDEEDSDEDESEDESDEEFVVPKRKFKPKIPEQKRPRLEIPKKNLPRPIPAPPRVGVKRRANNPPGPPSGPPPKRPRIRRE